MRSLVVSIALVAAFVSAPVVTGHTPALSQDFSITNDRPVDAGRRDLMRQLQRWWDTHAYYPRRASINNESGTVKVHLVIHADGIIWISNAAESSGSRSLDEAGAEAFRGGFVQPFPEGAPGTELDISVHFVLAQRHDQPVAAGYTEATPGRPFTITNDPVQSPILQTMMQKSCTGTVVKQGIRNHPSYGVRYQAQAVFFRRADGTPWISFSEGGSSTSFAPVVEVGKVLRWTGPEEHLGGGASSVTQYTAWTEKDNIIIGNIETIYLGFSKSNMPLNRGSTVELVCGTQTVPAITWNAIFATPGQKPPGDPP